MKIKSVLTVSKEEMDAICKVIDMTAKLTCGEELLLSEHLKDYGYCNIGDTRDTLIQLREIAEVEEECPKMY